MGWMKVKEQKGIERLAWDIYAYMKEKDPYPIVMRGFDEDSLAHNLSKESREIVESLMLLETKGLVERGGRIGLTKNLWFRRWSDRKSP